MTVDNYNEKIAELFIPDIFELVSRHLTQFDLVSLSKTCQLFLNLTTPILYRSITIDCNFSQFEKEYLGRNTTYIRSKFNFLSFMKSLNADDSLWRYIKKFRVISLPEEFYDFESFLSGKSGISFFKRARLSNICLDNSVGLAILKQLLNDKYSRETLTVLKFTINKHLSSKPFIDLIIDDSKEENYKFQNLNTLSIGPIKQEIQLDDILKLIDYDDNWKLQNLKLESLHKTFKLCDLLNFSGDKLKSSNYILSRLNCYENLKSLSLSSINFNQSLLSNEDENHNFTFFENLKYLELSDIGLIASLPKESLLHTFYKNSKTCNLEYVRLDLRSTVDDLIPEFFNEYTQTNQIKELDLTIRYNSMHDTPLNELINKYLSMVVLRQHASLEKLSIEIKSEKNLINLEEQLQKEHLLQLVSTRFENLKSLRIQVHFEYILLCKKLLFQNIPNLTNFWVVGSSAVPMHFGLGNMYPGIFDQWWRIIYLPKSLLEDVPESHPLRYIKIDECLFVIEREKSDILQPKNSIDKIFDTMTRVSFDNIMN